MTDDPVTKASVLEPAPRVWVRQAIDNMGWTDLGGELLVVDTLEESDLREEVFGAIRATAGELPIPFVINTHTHGDHTALNSAFRAQFGSTIVSQRNGGIPEAGTREFKGARRTVEVIHMPGCHTPEDCVVWLPDARVLFSGDLFGWGLIPYNGNLRKGQAELIRSTFRRLIELRPGTVVPGHGPLCSVDELERWLEYFNWLCSELRDRAEDLGDLQDARAAVPPPDDMRNWWRFLDWKHEDSVKKVLKAASRGWV